MLKKRQLQKYLGVGQIVLIVALAALVPVFAFNSDTLTERADRFAVLENRTQEKVSGLGYSVLGEVYYDIDVYEPVTPLNSKVLNALEKGLDPGRKGGGGEPAGGLYPVRKAMEQLAVMILFPLVIVSILHAFLTGGAQVENKLQSYAKQVIVVLFLLWSYPLWDNVLWYGISKPMVKVLTEGALIENVVNRIGDNAGMSQQWSQHSDVEPFAAHPNAARGEKLNAITEISSFSSNDLACAIEASAGDPEASVDRCYGAEVPMVRKAMHAKSHDSFVQGDTSTKCQEVYTQINQNYGTWLAYFKDWALLRENQECLEAGDRTEGAVVAAWGNIKGMLADTLIGWLLTLQALLTGVLLWFVWLGVIVARSFSFALAPVAIIWGLAPNGEKKPAMWFKKHAELMFMPVGLAFGMLIFYAVQVAVLAAPIASGAGAGGTIVGVAMKILLFVGLLAVVLKSKDLGKILSGDVATFAQDVGNSVKNKTVQVAGTGLKMGAGAAAGSVPVVGGALGSAMSRMANMAERNAAIEDGSQTGSGATSSLGRSFSDLKTKGAGAAVKAGRAAGKVGQGARAATEAGKRGAAWAKEHSVSSATVEQGGAIGAAGLFAAGVKEPWKAAKTDFQKKREKVRGTAKTADEAAQNLEAGYHSHKQRQKIVEDNKMDMPATRQGEEEAIKARIDLSDIKVRSDGMMNDQRTVELGNPMMDLALDAGDEFRVKVEETESGRMYKLTPEARSQVIKRMGQDEEFKKKVEAEARRVFGGDYEKNLVDTEFGKMVNVDKLMERSTSFSNAAGAAGQAANAYQDELWRREVLSHISNVEKGSAAEMALRNMDTSWTEQLQGETGEEYQKRLQSKTAELSRMAWYLSASAEEREKVGLEPHGDVMNAASTVAIDGETTNWGEAGSFNSLSPEAQQSIHDAVSIQQKALRAMQSRKALSGGNVYGLDEENYVRTGHQAYKFEEGSGMDKVLQDNPELLTVGGGSEEAYRKAILRAKNEFRDQLPPQGNRKEDEWLADPEVQYALNRMVFLSPSKAFSSNE